MYSDTDAIVRAVRHLFDRMQLAGQTRLDSALSLARDALRDLETLLEPLRRRTLCPPTTTGHSDRDREDGLRLILCGAATLGAEFGELHIVVDCLKGLDLRSGPWHDGWLELYEGLRLFEGQPRGPAATRGTPAPAPTVAIEPAWLAADDLTAKLHLDGLTHVKVSQVRVVLTRLKKDFPDICQESHPDERRRDAPRQFYRVADVYYELKEHFGQPEIDREINREIETNR
jgi:hypothetical protein